MISVFSHNQTDVLLLKKNVLTSNITNPLRINILNPKEKTVQVCNIRGRSTSLHQKTDKKIIQMIRP
jgi:hypothetical protein